MSGWVSIQRKLIMGDHPFFKKEPMTEAQAFAWMIASAAYEDTTHVVAGEPLTVLRGSFMTTMRGMQSAFLWGSDKRVRTFLNRLKSGRMIDCAKVGPTNAPKTHVTICNYDDYQSPGRPKDDPRTSEGRTHGRSKVTNNNKQITNTPAGAENSLEEKIDFWADRINANGFVAASSVKPELARAILASGKVTPEKMRERGIAA